MIACDLSLSSIIVRSGGNIDVCMVGLLWVVLCRCVRKSRRRDVILCVLAGMKKRVRNDSGRRQVRGDNKDKMSPCR